MLDDDSWRPTQLLGANVNYSARPLGGDAARSWSAERAEQQQRLQFNAMNLITLWGPEGEINDYSTRPWSGLYSSYYHARWKLIFDRVVHLMRTGKPVGGYRTELQAFRRTWGRQNSANLWPTQPSGDVRALVARLVTVYAGRKDGVKERYVRMGGQQCPSVECVRLLADKRLVLWTRDVHQLSWLCDLDVQCAGFDTNGVLYRVVGELEDSRFGTDAVFVKKQEISDDDLDEQQQQ
jgi:hypothetical protein